MDHTNTAWSPDGTPIAYERAGEGPPVILVGGAFCTRETHQELAGLLAPRFTVFNYDRRGRGASGDTLPYAVGREVEDLAAVVAAAGGSAMLYGLSSGGALALEAAASGLPVTAVAVYEPPYALEAERRAGNVRYGERLAALLAAERRADAVELFLARIGVPPPVIEQFRLAPMWPGMEALAHTLAYEHAVLGDAALPVERLASVTVPVLALCGGASPEWMRAPAAAIAGAVPDGRALSLPGQTHEFSARALAPVLAEFFGGGPRILP
ncbi:alpha/beta fold hydrolase [Streptomyces sp. BPTC-684]|uniref:alpha/beta fold hydrolase n=1 Tax=Streptomyces sp. BPTC-684 TaxID=3043734 RepID=UPI0024B1AF75|nr:alpha/beta fold hydrolase [Streptomyces sp. BPTC-684]WHM40311.1 alpha/beta fold hydrolase [Streptomyces sp. BPTC-684]